MKLEIEITNKYIGDNTEAFMEAVSRLIVMLKITKNEFKSINEKIMYDLDEITVHESLLNKYK